MANILIVDDSKTSRKFLKDALEAGNHVVVGEAVNGSEGLEMYERFRPDIVTMDITMPVMDGIEALKEITLAYPEAKVVMVTTAGQKSNMVKALKRGAIDFIQKPFEKDKILDIIGKVLG